MKKIFLAALDAVLLVMRFAMETYKISIAFAGLTLLALLIQFIFAMQSDVAMEATEFFAGIAIFGVLSATIISLTALIGYGLLKWSKWVTKK